MRLCSYTIVHDTGFAPNPFWGYCTLGVCTPNHQGVKLSEGDWIMGNSTVETGSRLVYAMRVSEALDFNAYFEDSRFQVKKPRIDRTAQEACGDNIYYRDPDNAWKQAETMFHKDESSQQKDLRHPTVFVAEEFYYFGESMVELPTRFSTLIRIGQGCSCDHNESQVAEFIAWLQKSFKPGTLGKPRDFHGDLNDGTIQSVSGPC